MRVLFVGNSHTYVNDMPHIFAVRCRELTGEAPYVEMIASPGKSRDWHLENSLHSIRFALCYGKFDYCVCQQSAHTFPPEEVTRAAAGKLYDIIRQYGVTPVCYMTWAKKDGPEKAPGIIRFYRRLAEEQNVPLAPVGEIFDKINREHPEIDLYAPDGGHASAAGDYLIAAAFAHLLTGVKDLSALSDRTFDHRDQTTPLDADGMNTILAPEIAKTIRDAVEQIG